MDRLARCASDGAHGEGLGCFFWCAIIAGCYAFLDDLNLAVKSSGATLNEGHIGGKTHAVDMSSGFQVVERIKNQGEATEPRDVKLRVLDVGVVCDDLSVGVESLGNFFGNLFIPVSSFPFSIASRCAYQSFRLLDMLVSEEELSIQVRKVNRVEVDDVNLSETTKDQVLQKLASDASCADHQNSCLKSPVSLSSIGRRSRCQTEDVDAD